MAPNGQRPPAIGACTPGSSRSDGARLGSRGGTSGWAWDGAWFVDNEGEPVEGSTIDLAAGEYVALCFIPDGMTSSEDKPEKGAKSHAELGMVQGFTVA